MNRLLSVIGVLCTLAYLAFLVWLFDGRWEKVRTMEPNNIGDLLAGAFGPLAIVWLVLGFFQQGIELRQNTSALELQAEELRRSVDQQRELVSVSKEQLEAEREARREELSRHNNARLPSLHFVARGITRQGPIRTYHFALLNSGAAAVDVRLQPIHQKVTFSLKAITLLEPQGERMLDIVFLPEQPGPDDGVLVSYAAEPGVRGSQIFRFLKDINDRVEGLHPERAA